MAEEVAVFSKEKAELILEVIDYLVKAGYILKSGQKSELLEAVPRLIVKNESGESIPAFGIMQPVGKDGRYVRVVKPTSSGGGWLVNANRDIPVGGYGLAQTMPIMDALGSMTSGYVVPASGSWALANSVSNNGVWRCVGSGSFSGTAAIVMTSGFDVRYSNSLDGTWSIDKTLHSMQWMKVVDTDVCP